MLIVDTSVWIQYFNGVENPYTNKLDALLGSEIITIGDLIYMEILQGISNPDQFNKTKGYLDKFNRVTLGGFDLALKAANNYNQLRINGFTIRKSIDVLIGTFCYENGCKLLHNDRDFLNFSKCFRLKMVEVSD
jgi:predicted nucleic acid-binding protein